MALTREDILVWIEPDQSSGSGIYDWSRNRRTVTPTGTAMTYASGVLPFNGTDNYIDAASAINLSGSTDGFTVIAVAEFNAAGAVNGRFVLDFGGAASTDMYISSNGLWVGRLQGTSTFGIITTTTHATNKLPASAGDTAKYAMVYRFDPNEGGGTLRINTCKIGASLADFQATATSVGSLGTPVDGSATMRIGARDTGASFCQMGLDVAMIADRVLSDAEIVALLATAPTFTALPLDSTSGVVDHMDLALLDATGFRAAVLAGQMRNVHISLGPGESHAGNGNMASGGTPGITNILQQAIGRAVGLSGVGLTSFIGALPVGNSGSNSGVHLLPITTSQATGWWAVSTGAAQSTIGLFNSTLTQPVRTSVAGPGARSVNHLQRQTIVDSDKWTAGFAVMTGMDNLWGLVRSERFDRLTVYANSDGSATGTYRVAGLTAGGDQSDIGDWTDDGPEITIPPDTTIDAQSVGLDPTWDGFAIENIGGAGAGLRLGFFDARSPDPGVRIGGIGLSIGGEYMGNVRNAVWQAIIAAADIDHLMLCVPITNDSPGTAMSAWWDAAQAVVRDSVAGVGTGGDGAARTFGIWIPVEGDLSAAPGKQEAQRARADLIASLAVELSTDLVSFPAFVTPYADGDATVQGWYDAVHLGPDGFGVVEALFEEHVMPRLTGGGAARNRSRSRARASAV